MEKLYIKPRKDSPEVILDPVSHNFSIIGVSHPENVTQFYEPVMGWLSKYLEEIKSSPAIIDKEIHFRMFFKYVNSATYKYLINLMQLINEYIIVGIKVSFIWNYEPEDDDMKEAGYELMEYSGTKSNYTIEACYDPI